MEFKDYYKIMDVSRDASQDEIKRAYRRLARKYHPDVSKESDAERRFKEIGEAYEVLKDPEKRKAYDQFGSEWKAGQEFHPPPGWDRDFSFSGGGFTDAGGFSDFFEALFGQARAGRRASGFGFDARGQDQHARLSVSLEDAFRGATRQISLGVPEQDRTGMIRNRTRSLNIKVPKGVTDGKKIRLTGQGAPGGPGSQPGDLYLELRFQPHRLFRAEERDIYLELPITPWEAALGRTVTVPTLGGNVELRIPPGSQTGKKLRLKGRGLPGKPPGDQFVTLQIMTPPADTDAARALYERMERELPMDPRGDRGM